MPGRTEDWSEAILTDTVNPALGPTRESRKITSEKEGQQLLQRPQTMFKVMVYRSQKRKMQHTLQCQL